MRINIWVFIFGFLTNFGIIGQLEQPRPGKVLRVRLIQVVDGDTYWLEPIDNRFLLRLSNADTWESRRVRRLGQGNITDEELIKGKRAKEAVEKLLLSGEIKVRILPSNRNEPEQRDSFGRVLGELFVTGPNDVTISVGDWLHENGHTRIK